MAWSARASFLEKASGKRLSWLACSPVGQALCWPCASCDVGRDRFVRGTGSFYLTNILRHQRSKSHLNSIELWNARSQAGDDGVTRPDKDTQEEVGVAGSASNFALRIAEWRDFRFPVSLGETVPLKHILHEKSKIVSSRPPESATNRRNLKTAIRQAKQKGYDPEVQNIFVDLDASERFASWRHDLCPCITRTRAASAGFYNTSRKRRISTAEMLKLQGIRPANMRGHGLSYGVLNAAVGNAMSACVLERLLPRIAYAIGCIPERMPDEWCHPGFIAAGGRFGKRKRTGA